MVNGLYLCSPVLVFLITHNVFTRQAIFRHTHTALIESRRGREVQGKCEGRRCSLKSWVFKSFLKIDGDAPVLVALGRSFHHRGTTHEKSGLS